MAEEDVGRVAVLLEERVKRLQAHAIKIRVDATIVVHIEDAHGVGALYAAAQDNQRALSSGAGHNGLQIPSGAPIDWPVLVVGGEKPARRGRSRSGMHGRQLNHGMPCPTHHG